MAFKYNDFTEKEGEQPMRFSSLPFLFGFLPITLTVYFAVPARWRNLVLLLTSLIFYGWGDDMMDLDSDMLELYYPGLGDLSAKQLLAKSPVMSYAVNEYVFMQCGNEDDAATAAGILQTRIDTQAGGDAFYPETIDQWKAARVMTNGAYVALIASGEHQAEIEDAWSAQFNG